MPGCNGPNVECCLYRVKTKKHVRSTFYFDFHQCYSGKFLWVKEGCPNLLNPLANSAQFFKIPCALSNMISRSNSAIEPTTLRNWVKKAAETTYHPVGTCKMGSDPMAVVDAQLRVHGIAGLRVADASIMPTLTSGNTNAPSIMIGEKAADMMLNTAA